MSANRLFTLSVFLAVAVIIAFTIQNVLFTTPSRYTESEAQTQREYTLGERYGVSSQPSALFSAEQIQREAVLGERYGVTPKEYTQQQVQREYWLGERYGVTP